MAWTRSFWAVLLLLPACRAFSEGLAGEGAPPRALLLERIDWLMTLPSREAVPRLIAEASSSGRGAGPESSAALSVLRMAVEPELVDRLDLPGHEERLRAFKLRLQTWASGACADTGYGALRVQVVEAVRRLEATGDGFHAAAELGAAFDGGAAAAVVPAGPSGKALPRPSAPSLRTFKRRVDAFLSAEGRERLERLEDLTRAVQAAPDPARLSRAARALAAAFKLPEAPEVKLLMLDAAVSLGARVRDARAREALLRGIVHDPLASAGSRESRDLYTGAAIKTAVVLAREVSADRALALDLLGELSRHEALARLYAEELKTGLGALIAAEQLVAPEAPRPGPLGSRSMERLLADFILARGKERLARLAEVEHGLSEEREQGRVVLAGEAVAKALESPEAPAVQLRLLDAALLIGRRATGGGVRSRLLGAIARGLAGSPGSLGGRYLSERRAASVAVELARDAAPAALEAAAPLLLEAGRADLIPAKAPAALEALADDPVVAGALAAPETASSPPGPSSLKMSPRMFVAGMTAALVLALLGYNDASYMVAGFTAFVFIGSHVFPWPRSRAVSGPAPAASVEDATAEKLPAPPPLLLPETAHQRLAAMFEHGRAPRREELVGVLVGRAFSHLHPDAEEGALYFGQETEQAGVPRVMVETWHDRDPRAFDASDSEVETTLPHVGEPVELRLNQGAAAVGSGAQGMIAEFRIFGEALVQCLNTRRGEWWETRYAYYFRRAEPFPEKKSGAASRPRRS